MVARTKAADKPVVKVIRGEPLFTDDRQQAPTRAPVTHHVKSWTYLFRAAVAGTKTHDIRILDRDYQVGDCLMLCEYDWGNKVYTGHQMLVEITYITKARPGDRAKPACAFSPTCLHPDYGVLSIRKMNLAPPRASNVWTEGGAAAHEARGQD